MDQNVVVRCRAIIIYEGKLLVVKHSHGLDFAAFPGGHLEFGESPLECIEREVIEELGIKPAIGPLLYTYSYISAEKQSIELFFTIENSADYLQLHEVSRSHEHEIDEYMWIAPHTDMRVLPEAIWRDFENNNLPSGSVRHLQG